VARVPLCGKEIAGHALKAALADAGERAGQAQAGPIAIAPDHPIGQGQGRIEQQKFVAAVVEGQSSACQLPATEQHRHFGFARLKLCVGWPTPMGMKSRAVAGNHKGRVGGEEQTRGQGVESFATAGDGPVAHHPAGQIEGAVVHIEQGHKLQIAALEIYFVDA